MDIMDIVKKVENHQDFSYGEIENIIKNYTDGTLTDEQFFPLVKAIYENNLSDKCLYFLTKAMKNSGEVLDLSPLGRSVDKHSTGGVSDTTTIALVPMLACVGTKMLKLSGRSLGFTGGTCDKLECFSGYKTNISLDDAFKLVNENGGCMMTSTSSIAPADKKIYALRDRTNLVDNVSLIASSVMSKKLATGADVIVLDVKYGNGAFMPDKKSAKILGKKMEMLAKYDNKKAKVVYSKMSQPLGHNVGTLLECMEAINVLKKYNKKDALTKACVHLGAICHSLDKKINYFVAKRKIINTIKSGKALEKLKTMVKSQGGSVELFDKQYPKSQKDIVATKNTKITNFDTKEIGMVVNNLNHKYNENKYGVIINFKLHQKIKKGDIIFSIYAPENEVLNIEKSIKNAIKTK